MSSKLCVCVCSWGRMFELLVLRGQMESRVLDKVVDLRVARTEASIEISTSESD